VEGFGTVHDPIHARAVLVAQEEQVAIISLEITSMPEEEIEQIRQTVSEKTGIKEANIWVCATHSFSSPHLLPDAILQDEEKIRLKAGYRNAILEAVCGAVKAATDGMQPAKMGTGTGCCDIVANRDVELEEGWWVGTNGPGLTDHTVSVIRFDDAEGRPIALISHFAMQSSVLDQSELEGGGKAVTSDVAGNACAKVEEELGGGAVVLYLIGAAGDQAPVEKAVSERFEGQKRIRTDRHEQGFAICDRLAEKLKGSICKISGRILCDMEEVPVKLKAASAVVPAKKMEKDLHRLTPTRAGSYVPDGEREVRIEGISLGDVAFLGVQPELNCTTAVSITAKSQFAMTLVCTMVNGASKYMADETSYDRFCYEAMNSPFGRGAAELLSAKGAELLCELKGEKEND
jgi:hypothetical protein